MSSLIPISTYNLALEPFNPQPALDDEFPVTIRLTMAAVDPEAVDDKEEPSTVRILKKARTFLDEDDEDDYLDIEADEDDEEDELDDNEEEEETETKKADGKKAGKKESEEAEDDEDEDEEDEEDSDIDDDDEIEEFVLCTLSPKVQFQQTLDLTISPAEEVHFVVTGSYPVHLTGNYIEHPADDDEDDEDDEDDYDQYYDDEEDDDDEEGYNLTPDEDELVERLEEVSDIEAKIEELVQKEANSKKRAAEEASESKKSKKTNEDKKKVQFTENLEQGPTPSKKDKKKAEKAAKADKKEDKKDDKKEEKKEKKFTTNTLLGGVITEDRKVGTGATAKSGNKVGIRYIGKLKSGKVFDKNTSGKPFVFNLGKGECIKGFDLGVAGMAVGGERRVVIPPKMAYGSQALPGIPANSELTFDIKLVSLK